MAWIRLSDDYNDHPKFDSLSDGAFRLWHQGMGFCRKFQTDGLIPTASLRQFKAYSAKRMRILLTPYVPGENPLWRAIDGFGIKVHDYLEWNLSKEDENQQREEAKQRMSLGRNGEIRKLLRDRDGSACRYCGRTVLWTDRRGPSGATYDHVIPGGGNELDNLVIACRGCNSKKGRRSPEQAGMPLLPAPNSVSKSDSGISGTGRVGTDLVLVEREREREPYPWTCPHPEPKCTGRHACGVKAALAKAKAS